MAHPSTTNNSAFGGEGAAAPTAATLAPVAAPVSAPAFEIVEYNLIDSNKTKVSRRISDMGMDEYDGLFESTQHPTDKLFHLINFFEMCLLLNYARKGVIITLKPYIARQLRAFIEPRGFGLFRYFSNNYFAISLDPDEAEKITKEMKQIADSRNNIAVGKYLGYVTPFYLTVPQTKPLKNADIRMGVKFNGLDYEVQLVPQIIIDKSIPEIKSIYERYVKVLIEVNKLLPHYLSIEKIRIRILPFTQKLTQKSEPSVPSSPSVEISHDAKSEQDRAAGNTFRNNVKVPLPTVPHRPYVSNNNNHTFKGHKMLRTRKYKDGKNHRQTRRLSI